MNRNQPKVRQNYEVSKIMREQLELVKAEKELRSTIEKINDELNQLLVEELQLKSNQITQTTTFMPERKPTAEEIKVQFDSIEINQQLLNLDTEISIKFQQMEEEDEDDEQS